MRRADGLDDFSPLRLATAYHLQPASGPPATIGIVDAYGDTRLVSDLAQFSSQYNLPACTTGNGCLTILNQAGATAPLPANDQGWQWETTLDVETVHALCQQCHIVLVQARSNYLTDLAAADDAAVAAGARVVSNSWGGVEFPGETTFDSHYSRSGVSFLFSTGDDAFAGGTQYPAASPYVTAVGGTTITAPGGDWRFPQETAWGLAPDGSGAGSGCSSYEPKPAWQTDTGCATRMMADVSADANPDTGTAIYITPFDASYDPGFYSIGGTSLAAPIVATVYSALDVPDVAQYGSWPYSHLQALRDITSGSTGSCFPSYFCVAGTGYDGPTGLGSPRPAYISFANPEHGAVGSTTILTGGGFTGATAVRFGGVSASFTVVSDTQINATVPAGATSGYIRIETPAGNPAMPDPFILPPVIASLSPAFGVPGTKVRLSGANLSNVSSITVGGQAATQWDDSSPTQLTVSVPTGADDGPITVTNVAGSTSSATFFVVSTPSIASFTPFGVAGSTVSITGSDFSGATSVSFNGVAASSFTVNSDSSITATVPAGATSGAITVTDPVGSAHSSTPFTVILAPTITSFAPTRGAAGSTVAITGTNFYAALGVTTSVKFGGTQATFSVVSDTEIDATVPDGGLTRAITVTNLGGSTTSAGTFFTDRPPSIISLSPVFGTVSSVLISGAGFSGATLVTFNGTPALFNVNSDSGIVAEVPLGMTYGTVEVTTPSGTASKTTAFPVPVAPTITSLSASSGGPNATITITGTGFTGVTSVTFNGAHAKFSVRSDTTIVAIVPRGASTGPLVVTNPAGSATSAVFTVG